MTSLLEGGEARFHAERDCLLLLRKKKKAVPLPRVRFLPRKGCLLFLLRLASGKARYFVRSLREEEGRDLLLPSVGSPASARKGRNARKGGCLLQKEETRSFPEGASYGALPASQLTFFPFSFSKRKRRKTGRCAVFL